MKEAIEKFHTRRALRLRERFTSENQKWLDSARYDADGEETETPNTGNNHAGENSGDSHGNTHLPYGIAKGLGLDTTDMTPRQVWDMLKGKYGITPDESYDKLEKGEKIEPEKGDTTHKEKKTTLTGFSRTAGPDTEYHNLTIQERTWESRDAERWELRGAYGTDGKDVEEKIKLFYTKEDLLCYLRDHGVEEVKLGDETIDPQKADIPEYVGGTEARHFKKIRIEKYGDHFDIVAEYLDGRVHTIISVSSVKDGKDFIEKKYSVPRSKITVSDRTLKADKERNAWSRSKDGSYFTDGKRTIGNLEIQKGYRGKYELTGTDSNEEYYEDEFESLEGVIKFLKENGVRKCKFGENEINPETYEIPKVLYKSPKGKEFTDLEFRSRGLGSIELVGREIDGEETVITRRSAYEPEEFFTDRLRAHGLGLDDDRIRVSDSAKDIIVKMREKAEAKKKQLERRKVKLASEEEEIRKKEDNVRTDPNYHMFNKRPYKDLTIAINDESSSVCLYGTDVRGTTKCIKSIPYMDDDDMLSEVDNLSDTMELLGVDAPVVTIDTQDSNGQYVDDSGTSHRLVIPPIMNDTNDEVAGKKVKMYLDDATEPTVKEFDTEQEALEFIEGLGASTYMNRNKKHFLKPNFIPYVRPKFSHAVIKKSGDKYVLVGDSDEYGAGHEYASGTKEECEKAAKENGIKKDKIDYINPVPNDDVKRTHVSKSLEHFDDARRSQRKGTPLDMRSDEDKLELTNMMKEMFDRGTYCMRRSSSRLEEIFDTHFMNLLEAGTSGGCANPYLRRELEERVFGIPEEYDSVSEEEREKYGYLGDDEILSRPGKSVARWYGDMNVVFKKDRVAERTTYCIGDSLDTEVPTVGYAGENPTVEGFTAMSDWSIGDSLEAYGEYKNGEIAIDELIDRIAGEDGNDYIELQFHGTLTLEDAAQIQFNSIDGLTEAFENIEQEKRVQMINKLEEWGVEIVYDDGGDWADGMEFIKKEYL